MYHFVLQCAQGWRSLQDPLFNAGVDVCQVGRASLSWGKLL